MENIRTYSLSQLESLVASFGQPKFRAKQLYEWLRTHRVTSYDQMTNLPKTLREKLAEEHPLHAPAIISRQVSQDGTRKFVLELCDGNLVETVGLPSPSKGHSPRSGFFSETEARKKAGGVSGYENTECDSGNEMTEGYNGNHLYGLHGSCDPCDPRGGRLSVCFSTQVGCPMECAFCATGREGFTRNLTASEMIDQLITVERDFGQRITSVVAMGQGEPFLNYDETMTALRFINHESAFNIGARHITISTCGLIDGIRRLQFEPEQFTLAVSLHSAIQDTRDFLMPRMKGQRLRDLKKALIEYVRETNRRVSLEYLLLDGFNDDEDDLEALIQFTKGLLCHVNFLPMNAVSGSVFQPSPTETVREWTARLAKEGVEATLRKSRGGDISGACGQLKNSL